MTLLAGMALFLVACGGETTGTAVEETEQSNVTRDWDAIKEDGVLQVATDGTYFPTHTMMQKQTN